MTKKNIRVLITSAIIVLVAAVITNITGVSQESVISGDEIINGERALNAQSIIFTSFDGTEHVIEDTDKISSIVKTLVECSYEKLSEDEYAEGLYQMDILTDEDTISMGIAGFRKSCRHCS